MRINTNTKLEHDLNRITNDLKLDMKGRKQTT